MSPFNVNLTLFAVFMNITGLIVHDLFVFIIFLDIEMAFSTSETTFLLMEEGSVGGIK